MRRRITALLLALALCACAGDGRDLVEEMLVPDVVPDRTPLPPLPNCTENFDGSCPDTAPACGANFVGGLSCLVEGLGGCYSSGAFSYKVTDAAPLTITLDGGLISLELLFTHQTGTVSGTMTFFDADGLEVDLPLLSNGPCVPTMPPMLSATLSRSVREITVTAPPGVVLWIDDFMVN